MVQKYLLNGLKETLMLHLVRGMSILLKKKWISFIRNGRWNRWAFVYDKHLTLEIAVLIAHERITIPEE